MMKLSLFHIILFFLLIFVLNACKKDKDQTEDQPEGKVIFTFSHKVNGEPLKIDTLMYVNEFGNQYMVNEIQYHISDVTLHADDGSTFLIDDWKDIHYIDTDLSYTQIWEVFDLIPAGKYNYISFTFGLNENKNQSLMFVNPPQSLMFWPEYLGGGYHYMKLNGKWLTPDQQISPFDFHLGIGQIYDSTGQITGFIQNYFEIVLPNSAFTLSENQVVTINIIMNIENWFRSPNTYDHNVWGPDIMQKQAAMHLACENGHDVFSVGSIE
jgi:hypothetical protein